MVVFCIFAALLLVLPALLCCFMGGWFMLAGCLALVCWLHIGWWVVEVWWQWREKNDDDYV
jgi:predicted MFS family arabinose efflux permease